jgi:hypothetical protein
MAFRVYCNGAVVTALLACLMLLLFLTYRFISFHFFAGVVLIDYCTSVVVHSREVGAD